MKITATLFILMLLLVVACDKDEPGNVDNIPGLGGDTWEPGPIDVWINDSLTAPYNISAKYKWDQGELDFNRTLTPPREEKIIPVLSAIKKVWISNYVAVAGELFMKQYSPKFFVLVGSASYNPDGTITLGTAEGGRRILLYVLNDFRIKGMPGYVPSDSFNVKEMFHTIEHEFGHILHQHVLYTPDFKRISTGMYTSNWNNVSDAQANQDGFISAYAMSAPDEDFVEMISIMLVEGRSGFNNLVDGITGTSPNGTTAAEAKEKLRQKEAIVVGYFKDVWNIDFYNLQTRTRNSINTLIK
ncbi:zinc-binding metallopeptidase [Chitinophaga japonensis]|uniref:Substrate import-associated zinc metallohydrolase lipoprotein n=1 Tax=Chitinophaga japonensis TaxID=104662 RepID=A0A562SZ04_CHIJA|nr:putative zinc-binding metallopeptidase [Chitinophaga japonensis]TWI86555.1 substrate import-associated zinc metallohydrolase lipoprotein [Chitinophaga japonensis]